MRVSIILVPLLIISCISRKESTGIILDKVTNGPIDSVRVFAIVNSEAAGMEYLATYSDGKGVFPTTKIMEGSKQCPNVTLVFEKAGYNQTSVVFKCDESGQTVYLEPK